MLLAGSVVIVVSMYLIQKQMRQASLERLELIAQAQSLQLESRLVQQQEVLLGLQAAVTLNPNLDRLQFYNLLLQSNVMYRHPSLLAIGLARPISLQQLPAHIEQVRADKRVAPLAYQHYQPKPIGSASPMVLEHLYPINLLTEQLIGQNLAESEQLKAGLEIARDTGRMLASPAFRLNQHAEKIFCLYAPIYTDLPLEPTVQERRAHHVGTIIAYIRLNEVLRPMEKTLQSHQMSWELFDQGYALQTWPSSQAASEVMRSTRADVGQMHWTKSELVHLPARQWRIAMHSHDALLSENEYEWLMLATGLALLCLLLVAALMQFLYLSRQWSLQMLLKTRGDENSRQQQTQLLAQIVHESHDPLVVRQPDGKIIYANLAASQLFAPDQQSLIGRYDVLLSQSELADLVHPISYTASYPRYAPNARQLDVLLQPIRNELLQTIAVAMVIRDVSIADGVITTDIFGRVDYLNPVASSLVGWELSAARGQMLSAIYQSVDRQSRLPLPDLVAEVLSEGGEYHGSRRSVLLNKFGLNFQVEECAARIRDEQTRTIGAVLVFRDISNWRELDERAQLSDT